MRAHLGSILIAVAIVLFAAIHAAATRYQMQRDGNRILIFDRWSGNVTTRY